MTFPDDAGCVGAKFSGDARFGRATFSGAARFGRAIFSGAARFGGATFSGAARFDGATFYGAARFDGVDVLDLDDPDLNKGGEMGSLVWPEGWTVDPDADDPSRGTLVSSATGAH